MRMRCVDVQSELVAYLDGELSNIAKTVIEQHLGGCEHCTAELISLQETVEAAKTWKPIQPAPNFMNKLRSQIEDISPPDLATELRHLRITLDLLNQQMQQEKHASEVMDIEQLSAYLRVGVDVIWDMLEDVPYFQLGYELRFKKSSIDEWIRSREDRNEPGIGDWYGDNWFQALSRSSS